MKKVAVLFARRDSVYKSLPECDVYDAERDALTYAGRLPVVAHPPCRAWGRLRSFAKPADGEKDLAIWAVEQVQTHGGVLEYPAHSTLWPTAGLPHPGERDAFGGWTLPILQYWFGHRADKATWLYIVGANPRECLPMPLLLGNAPCCLGSRKLINRRPEITKAEREHTPKPLATWLVALSISTHTLPQDT